MTGQNATPAPNGQEPGLDCIDVVELIGAYLEDALPPTQRARVERHLAECEGCGRALAQFRTTAELTGRLDRETVPEDARETLRRAFRDWTAGA
jgi:anti-sigma factor RsiW